MSSDNLSEPKKSTGQFHSVKGTVVETIGNLTGSGSWQQSGRGEHAAGEREINAAKAKNWTEGTGDRLTGKKEAVVGSLTGDRSQEVAGNVRHDKGEAQQKANDDVLQ